MPGGDYVPLNHWDMKTENGAMSQWQNPKGDNVSYALEHIPISDGREVGEIFHSMSMSRSHSTSTQIMTIATQVGIHGRADRQTESAAYEPTMQLAQVGLKMGLLIREFSLSVDNWI